MHAMRHWAVRHAGRLEQAYKLLAKALRTLRPVVRLIGPQRLQRPVAGVERAVKGFLFDCRMCGGCTLSATGMACPMNCPKQVRNGPCGGVRADGTCEVDPAMRCVGLEGWRGSRRMAAGALPGAPTAPAEHHLAGRSTWLRVMAGEAPRASIAFEAPVRPSGSRLEALLERGTFVVTAEFPPPDSAAPADVLARLAPFRDCVDALNVTDASGANCHMSSVAVSVLLAQAGCEPVMQITCRDRNRIAIQGDLLGAAALGIRNVLCLTGDHVANGDHPGARHVGDLDSLTLLATARKLRDAGEFLSGRKLAAPPQLFLGAAGNPFAAPMETRLERLRRKVAAGAQFLQTQYCFDVAALEDFMAMVRAEGLHERIAILIGVGPIGSAKTARWLRASVPGVRIPDAIVQRLEAAADAREEGRRIAIELIQRIRDIPGIAGVHVMAHRQEQLVRSIVADSGVLGARTPLFTSSAPPARSEPCLLP
ncbi:MAG: methylenetetrahydrofolate reductase C-terminal domain-containing protein [Burkholderiales bacterium]|nr:methylenetetrahydrofolate reductase C-terminal domain-containing protein [Burkholderiales bacterium]